LHNTSEKSSKMRFFTSAVAVCAAFASTVFAAENPISKPDGSDSIAAGQSCLIKWNPTTSGSVTLTLRQGPSGNLKDLDVIASHVENSGSYEWPVPAKLPSGDNYAIMITSANGDVNYTPLLKIDSNAKSKPSAPESSSMPVSTSHKEEQPTKTANEHKPKITALSNSTITSKKYTNSTMTKHKSTSHKTTLEPSTTEKSSSTGSSTPSATSAPNSGAVAVVRSPIALVACLVAGFFFLN